MIRKVNFVTIPVTDQDRALSFYTEKLGFKVMTDQPFGGGQRWIELAIPGAETRVVLFTAEHHRDRVGTPWSGAFWCDDVVKTHADLVAVGVEFASAPKKEPWGSYATFKDPDGNEFVLSSK